jgi:hypothetical protein
MKTYVILFIFLNLRKNIPQAKTKVVRRRCKALKNDNFIMGL